MAGIQTRQYTMEQFIDDVNRIMSSGQDRAAIVSQVEPLLARLMEDDDLLKEEFKVDLGEGRYSYSFFRSEDGSLTVSAPAFLPGRPTPVHDHLTWGVIGVYSGKQKTTRYRRTDDGSREGHADLELVQDEVLTKGATYPLLPPDDIHRIEAVGEEPGISFHVLGTDLRHQKRHIYHTELGTVEDIEGESMMR